jgi:hypothetical protein
VPTSTLAATQTHLLFIINNTNVERCFSSTKKKKLTISRHANIECGAYGDLNTN